MGTEIQSPEYYSMCWIAPKPSPKPGWTEAFPFRRSYFSDAEERSVDIISSRTRYEPMYQPDYNDSLLFLMKE